MLRLVGIPRPERRIDEYAFQLWGGLRQRAMIAHRAVLPPAHPDRRRADHRARRHHAGPDPGPAARAAGARGHGHRAHHPQPGGGGRDVRRGRHDVPRPGGRARPRRRHLPRARSIPTRARCCARSRSVHAPARTKLPAIAGSLPHPYNRPTGCPFHPRCPRGDAAGCASAHEPELLPVAGDGQAVSCFLHHPARRRRDRGAGTPAPRGRATCAKEFPDPRRACSGARVGEVRAVDGVSFHIDRGETLSLVGESGCGKTTTGALHPARHRAHGRARSSSARGDGSDGGRRGAAVKRQLRPLRREMQMVFQDPYSSLNPRKTLLEIVGEPLLVNGVGTRAERIERVAELLRLVGSGPSTCAASRTPSAAASASASASRARWPSTRASSWPTSPCPPSTCPCRRRSSICCVDLQAELGLTYLFVAHDLSVVKHVSDRVAVMYVGPHRRAGADRARCSPRPRIPYTEALLAAVPKPDPRRARAAPRAGRRGRRPREPAAGLRVPPALSATPSTGAASEAPRARRRSPPASS